MPTVANPECRMPWNPFARFACLILAGVVTAAGPACGIDGPRAAFTIEDDFLRATVTSDGTNAVIATVVVRLENGTVWARGETDEAGTCIVPMPTGERCEFEIRMPEIDPQIVVLTFLDGGKTVIPLVAPLNPGECCVRPSRPDNPERDPSGVFASNRPILIGIGTILILLTIVGVSLRLLRNAPQ
jgi:hypothetical protein